MRLVGGVACAEPGVARLPSGSRLLGSNAARTVPTGQSPTTITTQGDGSNMACEFIEARVLSAAGGRHVCRHPAEADRQTTVTPGTLAQAASFTLPDL